VAEATQDGLTERLSTWALREEAGDEGDPVSDKQIRAFVKWGLLVSEPDGRWGPESVARLRRVRELGKEIRALPRRAVRLRCEGYAAPPETLRKAMLATVPTITAPSSKLRRVDAVVRLLRNPWGASPIGSLPIRDDGLLPHPDHWEDILNVLSADDFVAAIAVPFQLAFPLKEKPVEVQGLKPKVARGRERYNVLRDAASTGELLDDVPVEEIALLLAIRALSELEIMYRRLDKMVTFGLAFRHQPRGAVSKAFGRGA
jgi:hypothetical protein